MTRSALSSDLRSVLAMFAPVRPVPQIADPVLPWTETARVDRGSRGTISVRHTPGIGTGSTDAAPVVLLHGITLTADVNFFALADLFGPDRPAIVFDLPNHGSGISDDHFTFEAVADDVIAILDHLGVSTAVACGYSLGGITAMVVADRHPSRIAGVVVQAAAMRYGVDARERMFLQAVAAVDLLRLNRVTRGLPARYWRASVGRSADAAARWGWIAERLAATDVVRYAPVWRAVARSDHRHLECSAPTAVLVLTSDRVCPPRLQQEVVDILGGRRFALEADHDLPVADPRAYASITDAALRWVEIRRHAVARGVV